MRLCPKLDRFQVPRDEPLTFLHNPQEARETPMSSSCGRPFDHISIHALIGASQENYVSHPTPKPTSRISSKSLDRPPGTQQTQLFATTSRHRRGFNPCTGQDSVLRKSSLWLALRVIHDQRKVICLTEPKPYRPSLWQYGQRTFRLALALSLAERIAGRIRFSLIPPNAQIGSAG